MSRADKAADLIAMARRALEEGKLSWAVRLFEDSLRYQLRAATFAEVARLYLSLDWQGYESRLEAGLLCAKFEENDAVHQELVALKRQFEARTSNEITKGPIELRINECASERKIEEAIELMGLAPYADQIIAACKPCIRLSYTVDPSDSSPSKFGGIPYVPRDFEWPRSSNGRPLASLIQIDFATLPTSGVSEKLPDVGLLSVFLDCGEESGLEHGDPSRWRVCYFPDRASLAKADEPLDLDTINRFVPCEVSFKEHLSIPSGVDEAIESLGLSEIDHEHYFDLYESWGSKLETHQLLGCPKFVNYDWRSSRALHTEEVALNFEEWLLLLQIDSDDLTQFSWGDWGTIYFAVTATDLEARRFDRCRLLADCF